MNRLQLKALVLSVITEIKFGQPLARNTNHVKRTYKEIAGLPKNASNVTLLKDMRRTYQENGLGDDFDGIIRKHGLEDKILN